MPRAMLRNPARSAPGIGAVVASTGNALARAYESNEAIAFFSSSKTSKTVYSFVICSRS